MKIGIITYSLNIGGVSTFILSLSKYFMLKGHSVEVITEEKKGAWFNEFVKEGIKTDSVDYGLLSWLPLGVLIHSYRIGRLLKDKAFDVILLNNTLHAQLSAHMYNKESIVIPIVHNDNKGIYQIATRNIRNIDTIVCVSIATYKGVKSYTNSKNIHYIPNGIELSQIKPSFPKNEGETLNVIFVGSLVHSHKGVLLIPSILKRCKDEGRLRIHLTIIGEGKDKGILIKSLKENNVYDLVTFKGNIPREEVYAQYLCHQIFLMPSFHEGLPLVLMESMACGCVPVASYLKDITDYCIENETNGYLVETGNINSFSDRIIHLGLNPDLINVMGERCFHKAESMFSINRMGDEYLNLIDKLSEERENKNKGFAFNIYSWKDIFPRKALLLKKYFKR